MEGIYDVVFAGEKVGRMQVQRQGLYYRFVCRCDDFTQQMYDVILQIGEQTLRLGMLVPKNGQWVLDAKLPVKRLGQGRPDFYLKPKHAPMPENFIPLHPQEPFGYLRKLENAYLASRNGSLGIVIKE